MDAASNRSVEDMTALLERAMYAPTEGRFKVYMIDEVHMLSSTAFNAMLKTLEEPPGAEVHPRDHGPAEGPGHGALALPSVQPPQHDPAGSSPMETILQAEGIEYEVGALRLLAEGARGSMRDGLSLLDQAIAPTAAALRGGCSPCATCSG